jgi:hypothetical protein
MEEQHKSSQIIQKQVNHVVLEPKEALQECCTKTIEELAKNNPMISCTSCQALIKCFTDHTAYTNYISFCLSKKRDIMTHVYNDYYIVIYKKSFDLYKK